MSVRVHFEGIDGPESEEYDQAFVTDGGVLVCLRKADDGTTVKRRYSPKTWIQTFEVLDE